MKHGFSSQLAEKFAKRFYEFPSGSMPSDDALSLYESHAESIERIIESIIIVGSHPWEDDRTPKLLYCSSSNPTNDDKMLADFCFPNGKTEIHKKVFSRPDLVLSHIFQDPNKIKFDFFTFYFPSNDSAPYAFCSGYEASTFTFPTFAHNLTKKQVFDSFKNNTLYTTKIFICIRTKFPFDELFQMFAKWILQSEHIGRMNIYQESNIKFNSNLQTVSNQTVSNGETSFLFQDWPQSQRRKITVVFGRILNIIPPVPGRDVSFDIEPFPLFTWQRPSLNGGSYLPLAWNSLSMAIQLISPDLFLKIFKAVCLERTIIVYHDDMANVTNFLLALIFALKPMRWVSGFISILPDKLKDMLDSPSPLMIGMVEPLHEVYSGHVYVDLKKRNITSVEKIEKMKLIDELLPFLKKNWKPENVSEILNRLNDIMQTIINNVEKSIVSNLSKAQVTSNFVEELFLCYFDSGSKEFLEQMCVSQMFRFLVEQMCKMKSDMNK
ncbi:putative GTPase activating protein [Histomonas meleagridis]|uniref:putative GTPase activating protein n=1 Tax=Histomonas meleagridis TaxID=135588 RepID=UPI00355AC764|nr:putative GTPase activating protein [Histomonas meleagridis]KAH0799353.1 putative GTPase activating protein [Histomonas meleagridis]